jgi:hypothetical protein
MGLCLSLCEVSAGAACNPCASLLFGAQPPLGISVDSRVCWAMVDGGQALLCQNSVKAVLHAVLVRCLPCIGGRLARGCAICPKLSCPGYAAYLSLCFLAVFRRPAEHAAGLEHMPWCCLLCIFHRCRSWEYPNLDLLAGVV